MAEAKPARWRQLVGGVRRARAPSTPPAHGAAAAPGDGCRPIDRSGADIAITGVPGPPSVSLPGGWAFAALPGRTVVRLTLQGAATFATARALQTRTNDFTAEDGSVASAVTAGLKITGFQIGIATGPVTGGRVIGPARSTSTPRSAPSK